MSWKDIEITPESVHSFLKEIDIDTLIQNVNNYFDELNEKNKLSDLKLLKVLNNRNTSSNKYQFNSEIKGNIQESIPKNTKFKNLNLNRGNIVA